MLVWWTWSSRLSFSSSSSSSGNKERWMMADARQTLCVFSLSLKCRQSTTDPEVRCVSKSWKRWYFDRNPKDLLDHSAGRGSLCAALIWDWFSLEIMQATHWGVAMASVASEELVWKGHCLSLTQLPRITRQTSDWASMLQLLWRARVWKSMR